MPFYFRRSVRLGGGVRMNLSQSGVGFSFGTKGCRVSTGPRGTYINIGANGVYYRQKIGGGLGQGSQPSPNIPLSESYFAGNTIHSASAEQLVEVTSAATLERLNSCVRQPAYAWVFVTVGLFTAVISSSLSVIMFPVIGGFALYLAYLANIKDKERRTYQLEFNLDDAARQRWIALNKALSLLAQSQALWRVTALNHTYDWKRNAGATSLLNRVRATLTQQPAVSIASNLTPYCLNFGGQQLFFFPDRIYVHQNGAYGAVEYGTLSIEVGQTYFIESDHIPSDAHIVGYTWQYVNKDGSPDRRFNYNRQLPRANYGVIELKTPTGLNILLHVSSMQAAHNFSSLYNSVYAPPSSGAWQRSYQQTRGQQPPPNDQQNSDRTSPRQNPKPSIPECYQVLGLTPGCTREQAMVRYRELLT